MIEQPNIHEYDELLQVWEEAVRTTHHFLTETDIQFYKPLIRNEYFAAVQLYVIREDAGTIAAFMGLSTDCIKMLFVSPKAQEQGYGSELVEFAIREKHIYKVDVNEQNTAALGFYLHRGFEVTGRDALDGTGKPFPVLHLQIPPVRLRKARIQDMGLLQTVFTQSVQNTCSADYNHLQIQAWIGRGTQQRWQELFQSDLCFLLAEDIRQSQIAGFTSINPKGYLHSMFVHPQYQHRGIASILLRKAEEYARNCRAVSVHSEVSITARPFFEKHGYITEKEQTVDVNGIEMTNFLMYKRI